MGMLGKEAYLENWVTKLTSLNAVDEVSYDVAFDWDDSFGCPGAFIIRNHHNSQIYLKTVTLEDVPGHGPVHFVCDSWVYPTHRYDHDRVFFTNKVCVLQPRYICPNIHFIDQNSDDVLFFH